MSHDVAIYAPFAAGQYSRKSVRVGGAERQTFLLAHALSEQGIDTAHIVFRVKDPLPPPNSHLTLVERAPFRGNHRFGKYREAVRIWRGLAKSDAAVYIVRTGSPALGIVGLFCRLRQRRLIFASSTDADFTLVHLRERIRSVMYHLGLRCADAVVVQTAKQLGLVRAGFPRTPRSAHVPSFAEAMRPAARPGTSFLWIGRAVDYKRPLSYVELARALPEARFRMLATPIYGAEDFHAEVLRAATEVPNLEILEPRPHRELMELMAQSVAIVNTSRSEGMPNIFLEGWASGIPALTLDFDPDNIIASRGIGVAAGNSWEAFVDGARRLWESRDDQQEIGRASRAYVEEVHGIASVGRQWTAIVKELVELP